LRRRHGDQVLGQVFRGVGLEQPFRVDDRGEGFLRQVAGFAALQRCEVGFGGVVLREFGFDVAVYGAELGLQGGEELGDGLVGAVFYFVPLEGLEVGGYGS